LQRFSHDGSRGQINAVGRNGMNMPIQGTAADMLKRALFFLDLEVRGTDMKVVNIVHDEIILEVAEADVEIAKVKLTGAMERAGREYIKVVPVEAEAIEASEWLK
jgi:DNA polymerase-1